MTTWKKNAFIACGSALVFSLLYFTGLFDFIESRVYDLYLNFRPDRERLEDVFFLDVDDRAIADIGVFPWPRSVMADGLLRLKEYGVKAGIFDIEYIDKSPSGLDEVYLRQGLRGDFDRSFITIDSSVNELFSALENNQISLKDAYEYAGELSGIIGEEQEYLLGRTLGLVRDNDEYLAQTSKLFGHTWSTLNLQFQPLEGEQAERRAYAEDHFAYPLEALSGVPGGEYEDVLAAIPSFMESAQGAGFTNVEIDPDGVRRRVFLVRKIRGHWYLQLSLAPLVHALGNPPLRLEKNKLTLLGARLPGGEVEDIKIPLDNRGAMLLDWPKTDYFESYEHLSFADFSALDKHEQNLFVSAGNLASLGYWNDLIEDPFFYEARATLLSVLEFYTAAEDSRRKAVSENSEEDFKLYLDFMAEYRRLTGDFIAGDAAAALADLLDAEAAARPGEAGTLADDAEYIRNNLKNIKLDYSELLAIREKLDETIRGKFCVIGRVDTGTTDIGVNPFSGEYVNVGTHAVVLDTVLSRSFLVQLPYLWSILITLIFVPLVNIAIGKFKPGFRAVIGFLAALIIILGSFLLFITKGIFFGPTGPVFAMAAAVIVREMMAFVSSEREKSFIHKVLSTYTSEAVAQEILNDPSLLQLGGSKRRMSAIFTDVQGFSGIAEKLDPEDLVRLLNKYLSAMSNVALDELGTIDKYEGDAIIAFFGAPKPFPDHAAKACRSAVLMKRVERELNKVFAEQGLSPLPLLTRIGINTGEMVVGNMGTENKMNYTIMGNAVNLAARFEGVNKQYGTWILTSDETIRETGGEFLTRRLDRVRVVGIQEPVLLYELLEIKNEAPSDLVSLADVFNEAIGIYEERKWIEAKAAFEEVLQRFPGDPVSANYIRRCNNFQKFPPLSDWDGVVSLTEK